jgi:hypothetical protein
MYHTNKPLSPLAKELLLLYLLTITSKSWKENQLLELIGNLLRNEDEIEFSWYYQQQILFTGDNLQNFSSR